MEQKTKRRALGAGVIAVLAVITVLVVLSGSDGGGSPSGPTPTPKPPWADQPAPKVYIPDMPSTIKRESEFSFSVDITDVTDLWGAQFDLQYDPDMFTFRWLANGSVGGVAPSDMVFFKEGTGPDGEGLLRVAVKWNEYADAKGGWGVNGSGTMCRLGFYAGNKSGRYEFSFPKGKGDPPGERTVMRVWNGTVYGLDLKIGTTIHIGPAKATPTPTSTPQ
jgi:hypothetical protein